jgi:protein subunit release factor B
LLGRSAALDTAVRELVGTHRTIEASARRGTRRRWFAAITLVPTATVPPPAEPVALEVRYVRARGPGGQNVNRRATAVQLRDPRTGVTIRCDEHRTQARNRAAALRRVAALATRAVRADVDGERKAAWSAQRQLTGRACVMHWRTDRDGALVPEAGDDLSGSDRTARRRST